jgi:hypothetical protein
MKDTTLTKFNVHPDQEAELKRLGYSRADIVERARARVDAQMMIRCAKVLGRPGTIREVNQFTLEVQTEAIGILQGETLQVDDEALERLAFQWSNRDFNALDEAVRRLQATDDRERERKVEKGRALITARRLCDEHGRGKEFLAAIGMDEQTANRYTRLGYLSSVLITELGCLGLNLVKNTSVEARKQGNTTNSTFAETATEGPGCLAEGSKTAPVSADQADHDEVVETRVALEANPGHSLEKASE